MIKLKAKCGSFTQFIEPLRNLSDFDTHGSLKGRRGSPSSFGRLDLKWRDSAMCADYVVYSYDTPIFWHIANVGWVNPGEKYSVTTSAQQGKIGAAISCINNPSY